MNNLLPILINDMFFSPGVKKLVSLELFFSPNFKFIDLRFMDMIFLVLGYEDNQFRSF